MTISIRNILLVSAIALIEALQILTILSLISSLVPFPPSDFVHHMFPVYMNDLRPEREMTLYHIFVFTALVIEAGIFAIVYKRLNDAALTQALSVYAAIQGTLLLLQIFAVFKIFIYGNPIWARFLFYATIAVAVLARIFWPEQKKVWSWFAKEYKRLKDSGNAIYIFDAMVVLWVTTALFVFDPDRVLARILIWGNMDQWKTLAWANPTGLYGIVLAAIVYLIGCYYFFNAWLKSRWLALGAMCLVMKWQFFHWGSFPIAWQYAQSQPFYSIVVIVLLYILFLSSQKNNRHYLICSCVGIASMGCLHIIQSLGADTVLMYTPLQGGNFFAFDEQFIVPLIFIMTLLMRPSDRIVNAACAYGLCAFSIHVKDSTITNFYWLCALPLVVVLFYWLSTVLRRFSPVNRSGLRIVLAVLCLGAVMTNTLFLMYPNVLNLGAMDWPKIIAYYKAHL